LVFLPCTRSGLTLAPRSGARTGRWCPSRTLWAAASTTTSTCSCATGVVPNIAPTLLPAAVFRVRAHVHSPCGWLCCLAGRSLIAGTVTEQCTQELLGHLGLTVHVYLVLSALLLECFCVSAGAASAERGTPPSPTYDMWLGLRGFMAAVGQAAHSGRDAGGRESLPDGGAGRRQGGDSPRHQPPAGVHWPWPWPCNLPQTPQTLFGPESLSSSLVPLLCYAARAPVLVERCVNTKC
jgi:hypothetical protein